MFLERNYFDAIYRLSTCLLYSRRCQKDKELAFGFLESLSKRGHVSATFELSICLKYGQGCLKDESAAFQMLSLASERGDFRAANNLAICVSHPEGLRVLLFSSSKGNWRASLQAACCYEEGRGTERDVEKAAHLFLLSLKQGEPLAREGLFRTLCSGRVEWSPNLHPHWVYLQHSAISEHKKLFVNSQLLTLLLSSKYRNTSSHSFLAALVKGVSVNVAKFLCHFSQFN